MRVTVVERPDTSNANDYYCSNRPPLLPSPLVRLPLGSVKPRGWLLHQLELMAEGMTGRLSELSDFLRPENGWFGGDEPGWEEQPYWLRGFYDLAALLGRDDLLAEAKRWIEATISSQDEDGYFGARFHRGHQVDDGRKVPDLWPHMVMLDAIISHHEHTGDDRVIPMMTRFFEFCRDLPDDLFIPPVSGGETGWKLLVQHSRAGDMVPHVHWLYNHTGAPWLPDLASRFFSRIAPPEDEWLDRHIVHFTQRFSYPGLYYAQSRARWHLAATEYWYAQHMATWGQQPRGIFGADERVRTGKTDPRQAIETCGMVEFAKSFYMLGRITGDPVYADRCEDVMLNHFPAAQTPDLKALHYLTASNQPQLDASEEHDYYNKGHQIDYSPWRYRCCQHNVAMGWPWYAKNLWQATADNGLAAWLYAASQVAARVGTQGTEVTIAEETDYPFSGAVRLTITADERVAFPLYLRVPRWVTAVHLEVCGEGLDVEAEPGTYLRIDRAWSPGDTVEMEMGMEISLTEWPRTGAVTVDRGPLSYSVRIGERWQRCGGTDEWPEWEVLPTSPWNYGLVVDRDNPSQSLRLKASEPVADQPWTVDASPLEIEARGRRIRGWGLTDETVDPVPRSPVRSAEPEEAVTLIPLGCARLRMSCLPVVEP